jgi:hypothetical protein
MLVVAYSMHGDEISWPDRDLQEKEKREEDPEVWSKDGSIDKSKKEELWGRGRRQCG